MAPTKRLVVAKDDINFTKHIKMLKKNDGFTRCHLLQGGTDATDTERTLRRVFGTDLTTSREDDPPTSGEHLLLVIAYHQPPGECSAASSLKHCAAWARAAGVPEPFVDLSARSVDAFARATDDPKLRSRVARLREYVESDTMYARYGITGAPQWKHARADVMTRAGMLMCDLEFQDKLIEGGHIFRTLNPFGASLLIKAEERHMVDDRSDTAMYIAAAVSMGTKVTPVSAIATPVPFAQCIEMLIQIEESSAVDPVMDKDVDFRPPATWGARVPPLDAIVARAAVRRCARAARTGKRTVRCRPTQVTKYITKALRSEADFEEARAAMDPATLARAVCFRGGDEATVAYSTHGPRALSKAVQDAVRDLLLCYYRGYCTHARMESSTDGTTVDVPLQWVIAAEAQYDEACAAAATRDFGDATCRDVACAPGTLHGNILSVLYKRLIDERNTTGGHRTTSVTIPYNMLRRLAGLRGATEAMEMPNDIFEEVARARLFTLPSNVPTSELCPVDALDTCTPGPLNRTIAVSGPVVVRLAAEPDADTLRALEIYEQEAELREPVMMAPTCKVARGCNQRKRHLEPGWGQMRRYRINRNNGIDGPLVAAENDPDPRIQLLLMRLRAATAGVEYIGPDSPHSYIVAQKMHGAK
jgi:hypothetical protein